MTDSLPRNDDVVRAEPEPGRRERRGRTRARFPGLVLIAVGVVILLDNLGLVETGQVLRFWPVLLIGFGVRHLVKGWDRGAAVNGAVLAGVGGLLLLNSLDVLDVDVWKLWPVFLIVFGFMILTRSGSDARPPADAENCFAFLGGVERRIRADDYRGGSATAFMGGVQIDLTEADVAGDEAVLHVFAMWGSIEIRIPDTWTTEVGVVPIMGGVEDKTRGGRAAPTKRLVVNGAVVMAGMEIRN